MLLPTTSIQEAATPELNSLGLALPRDEGGVFRPESFPSSEKDFSTTSSYDFVVGEKKNTECDCECND